MNRTGLGLRSRSRRALLERMAQLTYRLNSAYFAPSHDPALFLHLSSNSSQPCLADLFTRHGSDKGWKGTSASPFPWTPHDYADAYQLLFMSKRNDVRTVVECGIGTNNTDVPSNMTSTGKPGASLRAWRDFFPQANIIGLDIDDRILFSEERIQTYHVDQLDRESIRGFWNSSGLTSVEIIIDDGLHTFEAGVSLFESSIERLARDGIYVIEDVSGRSLDSFREYFDQRPETVHYLRFLRRNAPVGDNSLIVIQPG